MTGHTAVGRTGLVMDRIRAAIAEVAPGAKAILYGSRARGDALPDSDWDLIVLIDGPVGPELEGAVTHRLYHLGLEIDEVLSPLIYSHSDWDSPLRRATPFHKNAEAEGVAC